MQTLKHDPRPEAITDRPITDRDFLRTAGIRPDLSPRISGVRLWLLVAALLLAGSTSLFAGIFAAGNATAGEGTEPAATQCPM